MSQTRKRVHILPNFSRKEILQTSAEKSNKLQELNISVSSQNNRLTSLQLKNSSPGVTPKSTKARIKQQRFPSPYAKPRISLNRSFSSSAMKRNKSDDTFMTPQRGKDRMQSLALDFSQYNTLNHEVLQQNSTITHKLNEQLAKLTPANVEKQFYLCKEAFQDIVEAMKPNSSVLESIKRAYDLMIDEKDAMIEAQRRQINDFRGITQASTRASDASRTQLTKYMDVPQQRLKKGGREDSIKLDKMSIEDQVQELNSQLQDLQTREKNYQNCISELIKRGYPVNQIWNSEQKERHKSAITPHPTRPKFDDIPKLDLTRLDSKKNLVDKKGLRLNKLSSKTPNNQEFSCKSGETPVGFQDEFMAKFQEFSESWRTLIQDQTRTNA